MAARCQAMNRFERACLIVNAASGSNSPETCEALKGGLAVHGVSIARDIAVPDDALPTAGALDEAGIELVVIYTGDGTLRSALTGLDGWRGAVLVLPGGTTNLLSKALHGDRPLDDILERLPHMERRRRRYLTSPVGPAVIEVLAGPGAKWSDVREGLRAGDVAAVASTAVDAVQASASGSNVVLVDPDIGKPEGYPGLRLTPLAHGIEVEGYGADTITDYLAQGMALLRRDFRTGPHDDLGIHSAIHCRSTDGAPIELMLDGERACGPADMIFSLAELRVDLLASVHD